MYLIRRSRPDLSPDSTCVLACSVNPAWTGAQRCLQAGLGARLVRHTGSGPAAALVPPGPFRTHE